jgi:hypothetical protein
LATTEVPLHSVASQGSAPPDRRVAAFATVGLTVVAIAVHGYHPYAEDGGVYLAGIKRLLHPQLYPYFTGFVTTHLKFSLFAPATAGLVRLTHIGLMGVLLGIYATSIWLTLYAAWLLASRLTSRSISCFGAVTLLALTLTIPVAGTSLMLVDPYVTARSISTPCGILMLVAVLDFQAAWTSRRSIAWKSVALFVVAFVVAGAMHPLMAVYSLGCVVLLICVSLPNRMACIAASCAACLFAIALAACVEWLSPAATPQYAEVARTRTYWFLSTWQWYELLGLFGPLVVLALLWLRRNSAVEPAAKRFALMPIVGGATAILIACLFAHTSSHSYEVAKLQPLRIYQTVYLLMLLALGAAATDHVLKRSIVRWTCMFALVGGAMAFVQWQTFPHSPHIEIPWRGPANDWQRAFQWIRNHTPTDAVFALDADYISAPGEDSQNFRATAERSALPDYAKDGGIASIAPNLTAEWLEGEATQKHLDRAVGPAEIARLRSCAVDWVVLTRSTPTSLSCAFEDATVKVCALP